MPDTPSSDRAARTSSSLKGLMIALISFMGSGSSVLVFIVRRPADGSTRLWKPKRPSPRRLGGTSDCLCRIRADTGSGRILDHPCVAAHHLGAPVPSAAQAWCEG